MRLLDYNPHDMAGSYIIRAISCDRPLLLKISKNLYLEKEPARQKGVIWKDARQEMNRLLWKRTHVGEAIIRIRDDTEGQKNTTKHASRGKVPSQTLTNVKTSKKATKDSKLSKNATLIPIVWIIQAHTIVWCCQWSMTLFGIYSYWFVQVRGH